MSYDDSSGIQSVTDFGLTSSVTWTVSYSELSNSWFVNSSVSVFYSIINASTACKTVNRFIDNLQFWKPSCSKSISNKYSNWWQSRQIWQLILRSLSSQMFWGPARPSVPLLPPSLCPSQWRSEGIRLRWARKERSTSEANNFRKIVTKKKLLSYYVESLMWGPCSIEHVEHA